MSTTAVAPCAAPRRRPRPPRVHATPAPSPLHRPIERLYAAPHASPSSPFPSKSKAKANKAKANKAKKATTEARPFWKTPADITLHMPHWLAEPVPHAWTSPWVKRATKATLTRAAKRADEELYTLTEHEKSHIWTHFKLPTFFHYLDFSAFQDCHLWNLAMIHDIHRDFLHLGRKYRCRPNPHHHLKHFPDAKYVLWFIQPYRDFDDYGKDAYETIPDTYSDENRHSLEFYHKLVKIIQPHGKEIILSIPVCYYALLVALNCQIFNLETPAVDQEEVPIDRHNILQHKLSYYSGLREMFSYEVILAHLEGKMTEDWQSKSLNDYVHRLASYAHLHLKPGQLWHHDNSDRDIFNKVYGRIGYDEPLTMNDWNVIHINALDVIETEFGNNDGFFWEPLVVHKPPHYLRDFLRGAQVTDPEDQKIKLLNY
ncbi:hypothetical protein M422DRAFT_783086 [Sphaerobolus stellatus SS14]|uniref:Uncharacterized protein n=1 Tax=Sphaerobolus stellatus (strain SS14) TaxID=990650 RepID=A0A0C9V8X2_SPHS4|nr:hypothetical protein M422DRAFT_783086 [Sphaerobolus stellatus SS14]